MTTLSILDLVRVTEDTDARGALDNARDLAVHAEAWGYRRIWVAEHHNMPLLLGTIQVAVDCFRGGQDVRPPARDLPQRER
jgi:alkanesulfonate monooxygenase SsuD/methylene tetrahydromethanopterin reductase-like flavin-dependent oxidoreductase (luciferase family)